MILFAGWCIAFASATPWLKPGFLRYQRTAEGQPQPVIDVGAPDELQHVVYVQHLVDGKGFPVLRPDDPNLGRNYQSHQPPLYYLIAAGVTKAFGIEPVSPGGKMPLRLLNVVFGLATLAGIACAVRWGLGRDDVAMAAVAWAGLLPMVVALHAAVTNDPLLYALCTWTLALSIRNVREGWKPKSIVVIGLLAGLAVLSKTTGIGLWPILALALAVTPKPKRPKIGWEIALLAIPLLVALPWWLRNQQLYGDFLAVNVFNASFKGSPQAATFISAFGAYGYWIDMVGWWTARSFVGVFGYMDIFLFEAMGSDKSAALYRFVLALIAVIGFAGLAGLIPATKDREGKALHILNGVWLLVVAALFVRFNMQFFQGQARYLFPALAPISIGLGIGAVTLLRRKPEIAWIVVAGLLLVLDIVSFLAIQAGFPLRTGL